MNGTKVLGLEILGLAAVGALFLVAAPVERAQASLINPGAAATVQQDARQRMATEVRWHWRHHHHHHRWHWRRWHHHHHRHW
jgi:hypothetical protein